MRLNSTVVAFFGVLALGVAAHPAEAQIATQTVTFSVVPASRMSFSGAASSIIVTPVTAGATHMSTSMVGTSYAITTNETNQKITAAMDQALPAGVSLSVALAAPAGATSIGAMPLGTLSTDVVTGISAVSASALPIVYTLSTMPAMPAAPATRMVTFTITSGL